MAKVKVYKMLWSSKRKEFKDEWMTSNEARAVGWRVPARLKTYPAKPRKRMLISKKPVVMALIRKGPKIREKNSLSSNSLFMKKHSDNRSKRLNQVDFNKLNLWWARP